MNFSDARMLIRELPNLLNLPYPVVKDIRVFVLQLIPQMLDIFHLNDRRTNFIEPDYLQSVLKLND